MKLQESTVKAEIKPEETKIALPKKCSSCRGKEFIRENNELYCKKCGLIVEDYNYE